MPRSRGNGPSSTNGATLSGTRQLRTRLSRVLPPFLLVFSDVYVAHRVANLVCIVAACGFLAGLLRFNRCRGPVTASVVGIVFAMNAGSYSIQSRPDFLVLLEVIVLLGAGQLAAMGRLSAWRSALPQRPRPWGGQGVEARAARVGTEPPTSISTTAAFLPPTSSVARRSSTSAWPGSVRVARATRRPRCRPLRHQNDRRRPGSRDRTRRL